MAEREVTAVFSNMSAVRMPEEYAPYIERFGVYTSTRGQNFVLVLTEIPCLLHLRLGMTVRIYSAIFIRYWKDWV